MSSKEFRSSLKEIMSKTNKTKLFLNKLKHHRNLSTSIPSIPLNMSSKKIFSRKDKEKEKESCEKSCCLKPSLFNINSNSLEQISSYGTNNKTKTNGDTKEKEKEGKKKIFILKDKNKEKEGINIKNIENETQIVYKTKEAEKRASKTKKVKNKSQKILPSLKNFKEKENTSDKSKEKTNDETIYRKRYDNSSDIPENYLILPDDLYNKLQKPELNLVSPNRNIEGNYSYYINGVADSLKEFIEFDYDSIFSHKNKNKVKYLYYTTPMEIDDSPKKKLLLIDLDETLVHSEFRSKDNYKALDLFTKTSKCLSKTFSYSDENYVYYIDVFFRPHLKDFLNEVSKYFDLAIFTAAMKGYADTILDFIDPNNKFFQFRLYRDACIPIQQRLYIKDLRIIKDYDPTNVILMDNSLYSFMNQPSNGMLVNSFYTNHKDTQLISAKNFLINHILPCDDIRKECEKWYHFTNLFYKGTSKEKKDN